MICRQEKPEPACRLFGQPAKTLKRTRAQDAGRSLASLGVGGNVPSIGVGPHVRR